MLFLLLVAEGDAAGYLWRVKRLIMLFLRTRVLFPPLIVFIGAYRLPVVSDGFV